MYKKMIFAALVCAFCTAAQAQSLSDLVSTVKDKVTSAITGTSSSSIVGTWVYDSPEISLESDNVLAKIGGSAASSTIEDKIADVYDKVGMEGSTYVFDDDGAFTATLNGKSVSGTYTYDSSAKTITLVVKKQTVTGTATLSSSTLKILFDADKLMTALQTISSATSSLSSSASTLNSLLSNYDGMQLGFALTKQE